MNSVLPQSLLRAGCAGLLVLLAACGGGGGGDSSTPVAPAPAPAPAPTPVPPTQVFKLLPAQLGLAEQDSALLLALAAPAAVSWSSSNPAVATVDAGGQVTGVAKGSAVISAVSGTGVATATLTVYRAQGTNPDPSSEALIAQALASGRISADEALAYRVFAFFGDARLPSAYAGAPSSVPDHQLLRELSGRLPTLSAVAQEQLLPFLLPPVYAQSWYAQQRQATAAAAATATAAMPADQKRRRADVAVNCFFAQPQLGETVRTTQNFRIHSFLRDDLLQGDDGQPTTESVTDFIASVIEEVYRSETALFKRFPLSDLNEPCNGGDAAVDIYLHPVGGRKKAVVTPYPNRCNKVPSFMVLDTSALSLSLGRASGQPLAMKKREWTAVLAHEFLHVLQYGMDRKAACKDYDWIDEATAEWVMDHVDATANFEDGIERAQLGGPRRTGGFLLRYLGWDHRASIEKPGGDEGPGQHGYAEYLFFQFLARSYGAETIKQIFDAELGLASVEAVASVLAAQGGMKAVWPLFAQTLWIGRTQQVLDFWSTTDGYDYGLANIFEPGPGDAYGQSFSAMKSLPVEHKSAPRASFKLFDIALQFPGDYYEVEPRSLYYEHLKFSDDTVRSVLLINPIAILPQHEFMKLQAVKKVGGQWRAVEDWTADATKNFCRDKKDERLEELILIVSNSEVNRGAEQPFRIPKQFPVRLSTSNVGCWRWAGTASTTTTYDDGSLSGEVTGSGVVRWEVSAVLPGSVQFEPRAGFIDATAQGKLGSCTFTEIVDRTAVGADVLGDGRLYINLDLDLGFGDPPDRELTAFDGATRMQATRTMICPASTVSSTGPGSYTWLQVDSEQTYTVSADGQTIEGAYIATFPATRSSIKTLFKFTAERE